MSWQANVLKGASRVRTRVLDHTIKNNGGYLSQACSAGEVLVTLYNKTMKLGPSQGPLCPPLFAGSPGIGNRAYQTGAAYNGPHEPALDRLYFSPVHYALVLYSVLIEVGRLDENSLDQFNKDGSTMELIGAEHSPGHEVTAGSLAQCLSQAGGAALARRLKGETGRNFVFMSDGEFQEGQTWEAVAALSYHKIDNLLVYVDVNQQQCDGEMERVMSLGSLADRLSSFGARVFEVDGHDPEALNQPAELAGDGRPVFVLANTDPCHGIELLRERSPKLHYVRFKNQAETARYQAVLDGDIGQEEMS
jgi:transketolase